MDTLGKIYCIILGLLLLVGCRETVTEAVDDTVTIGISKNPSRIHPIVHPSSVARHVYQYIFLPLADIDPVTYEVTPLLIKDLASVTIISSGKHKGKTAYTMEMLAEAEWDDGTPITGHDYAFTIKSIKHPATDATLYRSGTSSIIDVEVDSSNPKRFSAIVDDVELLTEEIVETMYIYPKHIYDKRGAMDAIDIADLMDTVRYKALRKENMALDSFALDFNSLRYSTEVVSGSGPYRLTSWSDDKRILLERKENYWAADRDVFAFKAYPKYIEVVTIPDPATIVTLLKDGSLDASNALTSTYFTDLKMDEMYRDKFTFLTPELTKFYFIALNNSSSRLRSPKVRKALSHLTDVSTLIDVLEDGLGTRSTAIFHPRKQHYNKKISAVEFDIASGKKLLHSEGWEDTDGDGTVDKDVDGVHTELILDFYITGSEFSKNIALLLKEDYAKAGVGVNIISKPYAQIRREHLGKREYDMTVLALPQSITLDDPYIKWHSDNDTPTGGNYVSYRSDRADSLITLIRENEDTKRQVDHYKQLQKVMYDDMPVIFLYNPVERIVVNNRWSATATSRRPGYLANTFEHK